MNIICICILINPIHLNLYFIILIHINKYIQAHINASTSIEMCKEVDKLILEVFFVLLAEIVFAIIYIYNIKNKFYNFVFKELQ